MNLAQNGSTLVSRFRDSRVYEVSKILKSNVQKCYLLIVTWRAFIKPSPMSSHQSLGTSGVKLLTLRKEGGKAELCCDRPVKDGGIFGWAGACQQPCWRRYCCLLEKVIDSTSTIASSLLHNRYFLSSIVRATFM